MPRAIQSAAASLGPSAGAGPAATARAGAYDRIAGLLAAESCVILDGGNGTEVGKRLPHAERVHDEALWGTWALMDAPDVVGQVHSSYLDAGCDVISTNTWGLDSEPAAAAGPAAAAPAHWMDVARDGLAVARRAVERSGRAGEAAVAFSLNGDVGDERRAELIELLPRAFDRDSPDLILLETITLMRPGLTLRVVERLVATGIPVWVSFRRCRHGVCGVFGQHWGGPEGDEFGRAARELEEVGVSALLVNCLPPDHVPGMLPWLRDFTDMPLGVYPNLGYYTDEGWSFDRSTGPAEYAELAEGWRREGAQIIGGCCGVRPEHVAAAAERVRKLPAGRARARADQSPPQAGPPPPPWQDERGRALYPLELPEIVCEPGVFVPTQGSFLVWKHLFAGGAGNGRRCLDVGCGTGLLGIQLALNGAEHVHMIDIDRRAVANALSNAFRNGVAERISGEAVDLYPWVARERYDLVVASLYQMPVNPLEAVSSHRPLDYWGRSLLDHLITMLPRLLADGGVAYVMQLSILSQERTAELLREAGLQAKVTSFDFFGFNSAFEQLSEQIERVEELSDAHHLRFGDEDVMVAYLLEITR